MHAYRVDLPWVDANVVQSSSMLVYLSGVEEFQGVDAIPALNCHCDGRNSIDAWSNI